MPIAALIFGILGLVIFCWLGPVLGGVWAGFASVSAGEFVAWPVWVLGLGLGASVPLLALILGALGMKKAPDQKGLGIAAIVISALGVIAALIITVVSNGLSLAGLDQAYRVLAIGILVIAAVAIDQWIRKVKT